MLTKWKQTRTTFEPTGGKKTKKKPQDSTSSSDEIAISFVKPLACQNPFFNERVKLSKTSGKKRRKSTNDKVNVSANVDDLEPILCITSSHRVAILGHPSSAAGLSVSESRSRNYISRPGAGTSFNLPNKTKSLEGIVPRGAQYDPASNLMYAIRNGGAELAIWTAGSSSVIQGPDQSLDADVDEGFSGATSKSGKKRKVLHHNTSTTPDGIISKRMPFPEGKAAVTLTPFYIPSSSEGKQQLLAVGASGCCEDGSVWIAICRNIDDDKSFELIFVDGSSMIDSSVIGIATKSNRRKSAPAKSANWKLLDSRAVGSAQSDGDKNAGLFILNVQSVVLSCDEGNVDLQHYRVRVYTEGVKEQCHIERYTKQHILETSNKEDIIAELHDSGNSLCIVNKDDDGEWILSSIELSPKDGEIVNSTSSLPMLGESKEKTTLFSFGCLGQNLYAILSKESTSSPESSLLALRVVDVRRKVKLLDQRWIEGGTLHDEAGENDNILTKMTRGRHCRAMITNELNGSLALITSPTESSESYGIVLSKISTSEPSAQSLANGAAILSPTSLASALRAAASSEPSTDNHSIAKNTQSINLNGIGLGSSEQLLGKTNVDAAVDLACQNLSEAAKLIVGSVLGSNEEEQKSVCNGKTRKKSGSGVISPELISWRDAFHDGMATIKAGHSGNAGILENGLVNGVKDKPKKLKSLNVKELPKRYVDVAFKETISILLSLNKKAKLQSADDSKNSETIRQQALFVLLKTLQSGSVSARIDLNGENAFLQVLKVCPSVLRQHGDLTSSLEKHKAIGALDIVAAMLQHLRDTPERILVCIVSFLLRSVGIVDAVTYYAKSLGTSQRNQRPTKGARLTGKYVGLSSDGEKRDDLRAQVSTKLLAEAVLDFTFKIVTYSKCNHYLLSKSLRDILSAAEVETLLLTLSKLLKNGGAFEQSKETKHIIYSGTIDWISALTEAHMSSILKISDKGGLIIDRIQADVRSALVQAESANKLKEIFDRAADAFAECAKASNNPMKVLKSRESIPAYSIERIVF
jgi:hypothetical protein